MPEGWCKELGELKWQKRLTSAKKKKRDSMVGSAETKARDGSIARQGKNAEGSPQREETKDHTQHADQPRQCVHQQSTKKGDQTEFLGDKNQIR